MAKGVIYIMTTAVSGLVKIGMAQTSQFEERMRFLEKNGYGNVAGLKRYFDLIAKFRVKTLQFVSVKYHELWALAHSSWYDYSQETLQEAS